MRCGVEQSLAFEASEIPRLVVDEVVGAENSLVAAEDVMRGRDEGKVTLQPSVLGAEGIGHGHGLRCDKDLKTRGKILEHRLCIGNHVQHFEKVFGVEKGAELRLAVL